jgi:eukaryotic-like serine/threonine-protein kinase
MMADPEQLFGEALEMQPEQRAAFLDRACENSPEIRHIVDRLLRDHERAASFMAQPLFTPDTQLPTFPARFQPGQLIADRFLVVRFIARGGMGEVYEARDQFLQGAGIAVKIIRPEIAEDAANSSRFEQEVILARKVVHPNLCPIYEIFHCEQPAPPFLFLTMRLLQGQTLDAHLKAFGRKEATQAVDICSQLVAGVAALHAAGIIHRDLKPNNVMLEQDGQRLNVSIMDFGLARLHQSENTLSVSGMIAGTPGYLAHELLRGERPTKASDLYALGVVMQRVLTGVQAPSPWAETVESLLSPDPEKRSKAFERLQTATGGARRSGRFARLFSLWAAGAAAALGMGIWLTPMSVSGPLDSTQITFSSEPKEGPLFTDGARLYFESRGVPAEMTVSGGLIARMPNIEPGMRLMDISADGTKILEWKPTVGDDIRRGSLWVASSLGGTPRRVAHALVNTPEFSGAAFSPDGQSIFFTDQRTLYSADEDGNNVKKIWEAPISVDGICFSPDGRELTVSLWTSTSGSRLWRIRADGSDAHKLLPDWPASAEQWGQKWTPDGRHFTFQSDSEGRANVYELVSPRWFEFWKKPVAVRITGNQIPILASAPARDSKSLFVLGRMDQGAMQALDPRTGKLEPFLGGLAASEFVISPDRQWLVYSDYPSGNLWKARLDLSEPLQLTHTGGFRPQWSPDGKWLVYTDAFKLFLISADGGTPEKLIATGEHEVSPAWSPDGKSILFSYYNFTDQPSGGIFRVDLATRKVSLVPNSDGLSAPSWSPNGKFMVAIASKPSRMMLYSTETKAWTVLTEFKVHWGFWTWTSDSKALYMGLVQGQNGIYRISVPDGKWKRVADVDSGYLGSAGSDANVSLTADGQPAMMTYIGVAQVYSLQWKH